MCAFLPADDRLFHKQDLYRNKSDTKRWKQLHPYNNARRSSRGGVALKVVPLAVLRVPASALWLRVRSAVLTPSARLILPQFFLHMLDSFGHICMSTWFWLVFFLFGKGYTMRKVFGGYVPGFSSPLRAETLKVSHPSDFMAIKWVILKRWSNLWEPNPQYTQVICICATVRSAYVNSGRSYETMVAGPGRYLYACVQEWEVCACILLPVIFLFCSCVRKAQPFPFVKLWDIRSSRGGGVWYWPRCPQQPECLRCVIWLLFAGLAAELLLTCLSRLLWRSKCLLYFRWPLLCISWR